MLHLYECYLYMNSFYSGGKCLQRGTD